MTTLKEQYFIRGRRLISVKKLTDLDRAKGTGVSSVITKRCAFTPCALRVIVERFITYTTCRTNTLVLRVLKRTKSSQVHNGEGGGTLKITRSLHRIITRLITHRIHLSGTENDIRYFTPITIARVHHQYTERAYLTRHPGQPNVRGRAIKVSQWY